MLKLRMTLKLGNVRRGKRAGNFFEKFRNKVFWRMRGGEVGGKTMRGFLIGDGKLWSGERHQKKKQPRNDSRGNLKVPVRKNSKSC